MKELKFFNIIPENINTNIDNDKLEEFLLNKKLLQYVKVGKQISTRLTSNICELISLFEFDPKNAGYKYTSELVSCVYDFLLIQYKSGLGNIIIFNLDFEDETFGYSKDEKYKIALNYFNNISSKWISNSARKIHYDENNDEIPENKFETLKRKRESFKDNLKDKRDIVIAYLKGDYIFFDRTVFESDNLIQKIFQFENDLKILIKLNRKFSFTKDDVFTPKPKSKQIFEEFQDKFHSLKQIKFIEKQLENLSNQNHAFVVSLFYFLKKEIGIKTPSAKIFREIINENYSLNIGEIKLSDPNNLKHKERIKKIHEDWH